MARIVYFSFPAHGHVNPTLAVVRELVRRREQVLYYCTESFEPAIRDTGALFQPYGAKFSMPGQGPGPFAQVSTTLEKLLELSCNVLESHLEQVRAWRPTHIMYDSFAPWGSFIAEVLQLRAIASIPSILVNACIDSRYGHAAGGPGDDPRLTAQWCAEFHSLCRSRLSHYGIRNPPSPPELLQSYGALNLIYTSRSFQPAADMFDAERFRFVGPCFASRPDAPTFQFERLDGRPLVFISLGTVYANRPRFFRTCIAELADSPWQVVLATGGYLRQEGLGPLPENFIVESFVPQVDILRQSAAFVTHGGMNSVQEALYHGVPLVAAPQAADQFWISARSSELGAAVVLDATRMEPGCIRTAVAKVLSDPTYTAAAARIGESLRASGGYRRAADEIQDFVGHAQGSARPSVSYDRRS